MLCLVKQCHSVSILQIRDVDDIVPCETSVSLCLVPLCVMLVMLCSVNRYNFVLVLPRVALCCVCAPALLLTRGERGTGREGERERERETETETETDRLRETERLRES